MAASPDYTDFNFNPRFAGETLEYDLTITIYNDTTKTDDPVAISSLSEIWFTARESESQADPATLTATKTGGSIAAVDDPGGIARVTIAAADTDTITKFVTLLCDVKVKESTGRETVTARGKISIRPTPTRATA